MGFYHTCALLSGGTVDCWGSNEYGQLGINDAVTERKVASSAPTEVKLQEGGFSRQPDVVILMPPFFPSPAGWHLMIDSRSPHTYQREKLNNMLNRWSWMVLAQR